MKIRYIGESFYGADGLTDGEIYECLGLDVETETDALLRVIDNSGEDYLYSPTDPAPWDGSSPGGKLEIIEDDEKGTLAKVIK